MDYLSLERGAEGSSEGFRPRLYSFPCTRAPARPAEEWEAWGSSGASSPARSPCRSPAERRFLGSRAAADFRRLRHFRSGKDGGLEDGGFCYQPRHEDAVPPPRPRPRGKSLRVPQLRLEEAARRSSMPCALDQADSFVASAVVEVDVWVVGDEGVGKTELLKKVAAAAKAEDSCDPETDEEPVVSVLVDKEEIVLHFRECQTLQLPCKLDSSHLNSYVIAYSVNSKESFFNATVTLNNLIEGRKMSRGNFVPLVLVGTKNDLQRKRNVFKREGRALSKIYRCKFMETSSLLGFHVDGLLTSLLSEIRQLIDNDKERGCSAPFLPLNSVLIGTDVANLASASGSSFFSRLRRQSYRMVSSCENIIARFRK